MLPSARRHALHVANVFVHRTSNFIRRLRETTRTDLQQLSDKLMRYTYRYIHVSQHLHHQCMQ
jgi:hypothetical protein